MVTDREYQYWLTRNCDRQNCWVVVARLGEMLIHEDTKVYDVTSGKIKNVLREELPLQHRNLQYVYLVSFTGNKMLAVVQDQQYYYLIENEELIPDEKTPEGQPVAKPEEQEDKGSKAYKSEIWYHRDLEGILGLISGSRRKALGIKPKNKIKFKAKETEALKGVTCVDFIGKTHEEQVSLWKRFVLQEKDRLDLSGLFVLNPSVIVDAGVRGTQHEIIVHQNNQFVTYQWLVQFPKVKTLSIWYVNAMTDDSVGDIVKFAPQLETLELHNCYQLTGRVLISLSKMNLLSKLIINNVTCSIQEHSYDTVISDDEWSKMENHGLEVLLIDSYNLTLDFIHFLLKSFKGLQHFIMNPIVMDKLDKNSVNGFDDEVINFHSVDDLQKGFKRHRGMKVYDLVRNKCGNTFSTSMLKKIKEMDPDKSNAVDILMDVSGAAV